MAIKLEMPRLKEIKPRITVMGIGGAGGNAINNMIAAGLEGVHFVAANTDAQALVQSAAESQIQLGAALTEGLGAGSKPEVGAAAAEEAIEEVRGHIAGSHMLFIAAGMGGGTGSGAAGVVARAAREMDMLVVAIVTKPFHFEGTRRMRIADAAIADLRQHVDTLIVIPNQNLFRVASEKTTFADAFLLADQVLYSGIACIVDLVLKEGLINLDFADVRTVMKDMGAAMMGTGEASGTDRALKAAEEAIANPLLEEVSMSGARGLLLSITGSRNLTLFEVDQAASRIRQEVDPEANIIVGATFDESLGDRIRVSIVASGMPHTHASGVRPPPLPASLPGERMAQQRQYAPPGYTQRAVPPPQRGDRPELEGDVLKQRLSAAMQADPVGQALPGSVPAAGERFDAARQQRGPAEVWQAPGGVQIEPAPRHGVLPGESDGESAPAYLGSFTAAPPVDVRPPSRRIPDLSEFPEVAQREYHAKVGEAAAGREPPEQRRPGLLRRLATSLGGSHEAHEDRGDPRRSRPHTGGAAASGSYASEGRASHHGSSRDTFAEQHDDYDPTDKFRSGRN